MKNIVCAWMVSLLVLAHLSYADIRNNDGSKAGPRPKSETEKAVDYCRKSPLPLLCLRKLTKSYFEQVTPSSTSDQEWATRAYQTVIGLQTRISRVDPLLITDPSPVGLEYMRGHCPGDLILRAGCLYILELQAKLLKVPFSSSERIAIGRVLDRKCALSSDHENQRLNCYLRWSSFLPEFYDEYAYPRPTTGKEAHALTKKCMERDLAHPQRFFCLYEIYTWWYTVSGYYRKHNVWTSEIRNILELMMIEFPHPDTVKNLKISREAEGKIAKIREKEKACDKLPALTDAQKEIKNICYSEILTFWDTGGGAGMISWSHLYEIIRIEKKNLILFPQDSNLITDIAQYIWSIEVDRVRAHLVPLERDISDKPLLFLREAEKMQSKESLFDFYASVIPFYYNIFGNRASISKAESKKLYRDEAFELFTKMKAIAVSSGDRSQLAWTAMLERLLARP